ncbi:carboxylesterase NlhH [Aspergillus lentulus]|uniref:Carboxylesterase NlhH n=1 Tax=Aspergillus lentulus TaxID=293939 RepID=A0ABQ1AJX5_ASPLE|nr:carboxylesterase NlhH [Aspergillus lentulus]GFF38412.1 carboxylesterase NlhH [Aspergillus lentulus]GFF80228.1 carboxylesterase NlhH [Aspergillus lentulus]GFF83281.1 carboxylesterase NlhH [Aspergillus lentulus]GFF89298.1 carboxylesterase NlhH [Aspergillus lentulus]GFG07403.1 carboxylesterase NlhH [Aspergillus lentulus]
MASLSTFLRYLRLKLLVSFYRLIVRIFASPPRPRPDSVLRIPSRDKGRTIKAHLYKPSGQYAGSKGPHRVLLNFYGSGFAIPLYGADDSFCRFIATTAGYVVLDVEYRLAPEYQIPAAVHDVEDAVKYVLDRPQEYSTSQVSVSGFSSGGTLALVAPTLFPPGTFQSTIAFYPATDLARDPSVRKAPALHAKPRSPFWTRIFREAYIGTMDPRDPRISPAYADASKYPANMLVVTAELDSSALEAEDLAKKAEMEGVASGRNVVIRRMKGCGHAFDKKNADGNCVQARDEAYGLAVDMLKKVAGESG